MARLRRRVKIRLTPELMISCLQSAMVLPGDTRLFNVGMDEEREYVDIALESNDFSEIWEGHPTPITTFPARFNPEK